MDSAAPLVVVRRTDVAPRPRPRAEADALADSNKVARKRRSEPVPMSAATPSRTARGLLVRGQFDAEKREWVLPARREIDEMSRYVQRQAEHTVD